MYHNCTSGLFELFGPCSSFVGPHQDIYLYLYLHELAVSLHKSPTNSGTSLPLQEALAARLRRMERRRNKEPCK